MKWILCRMFCRPVDGEGDSRYREAMMTSGDLLARMRESSTSTDPARAVMADIWAQHNNIPFMTTVYEAVQEMKSATSESERHGFGTRSVRS